MAPSANAQGKFRYLAAHGAGEEIAQLWAMHVRSHLELVCSEPAADDLTPVGASKLGGSPDVAVGASWPRRPPYAYNERRAEYLPAVWRAGRCLPFLGQINLADAAANGSVLPDLPDTGLLQLFYDTELQPWGFDPADRVGFQLQYVPAGVLLQRLDPPDSEWRLAGPVAPVKLVAGTSLPDARWLRDRLIESGWTIDRFWEEHDKIDADVQVSLTPSGHVFGGWPSLVQNPFEVECELVTNGIDCGAPDGYASDEAKRLRRSAHLWRQVFQIDSDGGLDWMWGDLGRLYAMIREPDIAHRDFHKAHLILQCS